MKVSTLLSASLAVLLPSLALAAPTPEAEAAAGAADTTPVDALALFKRSIGVYRPIKSASNTGRCLDFSSGRIVLSSCLQVENQFWGPFRTSDNIYRFQNHATADCIWLDSKVSGLVPVLGGCTLSDGSGVSVSNAEWDIGLNMPPSTITTMKSRIGHTNTNLCLTNDNDVQVTVRTCVTNANNQRWILGAD